MNTLTFSDNDKMAFCFFLRWPIDIVTSSHCLITCLQILQYFNRYSVASVQILKKGFITEYFHMFVDRQKENQLNRKTFKNPIRDLKCNLLTLAIG